MILQNISGTKREIKNRTDLMNRLEQLMSKYSELSFTFTNRMPDFQGACIFNNEVYINSNRTYRQNLQDTAEEIGHWKTTAGNIMETKTLYDQRQELEARQLGYMMIVGLDGLINCFDKGITTPWDIADYFECNIDYVWSALNTYKVKYGENFDYKGYNFDLRRGFNMAKIKIASRVK